MTLLNRQIVVARMPVGPLSADDFAIDAASIPRPADDEVLVRTLLLSIDAASRAWLQGLTYRSQIAEGEVMAGLAISEVVESRSLRFTPGDVVFGDTGWQDYATVPAAKLSPQRPTAPLTHALSLYGTSALTAYFGLVEVGRVQPGEQVIISAAAGSVGVAAGQIAKALGARVVGIAGGDDKCRWLVAEVGFDRAINYKTGNLAQELRGLDAGINVYFDNVGGEVLDRCLFAMSPRGRVVCCGAVSAYDAAKPAHGPRGVPGLLVTKRLRMEGFIVDDFATQHDDAVAALAEWAQAGRLRAYEHVVEGLENAPAALVAQLAGANRGKMIVRVDPSAV